MYIVLRRVIPLTAILLLLLQCTLAQQQASSGSQREIYGSNSLVAIQDKHRALLIVLRSNMIDASDNERAIIDFVLKADPIPKGRYIWVYGSLAKKLNAYIRKYRSLTAARELAEADFVIFFNLLEYRRILNTTYPYGELFVIVKGEPTTDTRPRIIWRSRKILYSSDAIGDFIRELKQLRGEN